LNEILSPSSRKRRDISLELGGTVSALDIGTGAEILIVRAGWSQRRFSRIRDVDHIPCTIAAAGAAFGDLIEDEFLLFSVEAHRRSVSITVNEGATRDRSPGSEIIPLAARLDRAVAAMAAVWEVRSIEGSTVDAGSLASVVGRPVSICRRACPE
jgi:hypothetical protein